MKIIITLLLGAVVGNTCLAQSYSGFDGNGNYYHGRMDNNGNYSGFDGNGNYHHGRVDNNGNYSGFDGNGNYYHGSFR